MKRLPDISQYYTEALAQREERDWIDRPAEHDRRISFMVPLIREAGIKTVCELACGSGHIAGGLPGDLLYKGYDLNRHFLEMARNRCRGKGNYTFLEADLRTVSNPADLSMMWGSLKHFHLDEFDGIVAKLLSLGKYTAFDMQIADRDFDNGTMYHHTFVTRERMLSAIEAGGHNVLYLVEMGAFEVSGFAEGMSLPACHMTFWTKRKP